MADSSRWDEIELLVRRAQRRDEDAFRALLDQHRDAVVSTLFACGVRCRETARDLAQDVAVRAWQRLDTIKDPRAFPAWLRRIAANAARDNLRRAAVRKEDVLDEALEFESGDDPHQQAERVAEVRYMLSVLADEDDEVVELLVARADGVPVERLAASMGISPDALKMRLMRARKRLRARLEALRKGGPV
ncbi:MAG: sigma-70 family RNA polymerase sigma factor [Holophagae bacterium]|jgi:RNA polymerase sigma-70 factor (ECF subfamily)